MDSCASTVPPLVVDLEGPPKQVRAQPLSKFHSFRTFPWGESCGKNPPIFGVATLRHGLINALNRAVPYAMVVNSRGDCTGTFWGVISAWMKNMFTETQLTWNEINLYSKSHDEHSKLHQGNFKANRFCRCYFFFRRNPWSKTGPMSLHEKSPNSGNDSSKGYPALDPPNGAARGKKTPTKLASVQLCLIPGCAFFVLEFVVFLIHVDERILFVNGW